ncbi:hypothetical protein [Ralstonia chuxiongensis]|uniref:Uncharacterized protein n=1 Tax=Ralstonia chuxiongensis TaxID=2957504 RepID=A0AA41WRG1_9RALS|nr:hypothetical protein [Ralstonia chuxiongensis]MCP1173651.1 hypothetical protein [Ralstonia chuxiongensis]
MSDGLKLKERAETDPVLQRVLEAYREKCHTLARGYWKSFLEISVTSGMPSAATYISRFEAEIAQQAAKIEAKTEFPGLGEQYLAYIEEERERLLQEYQRDPEALRRSLGAPPLIQEITSARQDGQRMSMGELAARTAVRATVWTLVRDAIRAILR